MQIYSKYLFSSIKFQTMIGLLIHKSDYFYKKTLFYRISLVFRILATQDKQSLK